ncbi:MAG: hypothetical protein QXU11_09610 [Thermoproteota archaeon]
MTGRKEGGTISLNPFNPYQIKTVHEYWVCNPYRVAHIFSR